MPNHTVINAKSPSELAMRIGELEKRGWEVISTSDPELREHKFYSYNDSRIGVKKTYLGSDGYTNHRAVMRNVNNQARG